MLRARGDEPLPERDRQVFEQVVPSDHYLRRVAERVDFERFRARLAEAYSAGMGRPALDPVFMLKVLFLRFHYKLSDRQVMERTRTDMAFRWFLDLGLGGRCRTTRKGPTSAAASGPSGSRGSSRIWWGWRGSTGW